MKIVFPGAVWLLAMTASTVDAAPPAPVAVTQIVQREVVAGQTFVGTVLPSKMAIIGSAVDGRVVEFPLNAGERAGKGQMLAQLLTDTIKLELEAAEAELDLRRQELAELENGTRPEEIEQAKSRMVAAEARMNYMAARHTRTESLFTQGRTATKEQADEAASAAVEAEQAYIDAKAAYELAIEGPRQEKIGQARAVVARQQALVHQLADQIEKHTVISRFDGYVTEEHTEVGQWVKKGDPVAEVAALDVVEIVAYVTEQDVPHIAVGMTVRVEIPALADRVFTGQIAFVVPQADVRTRTFPVRIRVQNEITDRGPLLSSGMYARVALPTGEKQQALLVPKDALVLGGPQPLVYIVDAADARQGKARPVPVELGVASGHLIQVKGSLERGTMVVVQGNERLRPGQDVSMVRTIPEKPAESGSSPQNAAP